MAYAVRRPVENLYLVRERDRQRTRELVALALVAVPPAVVLFLAIWANLETVRRRVPEPGSPAQEKVPPRDGPRPGRRARARRAHRAGHAGACAAHSRPGHPREGRGSRLPASGCARPAPLSARTRKGRALSAAPRPDRRALLMLGGVGLWILMLLVRLVDLQVLRTDEFTRRAARQQA